MEYGWLGPTPIVSELVRLLWDLRIYMSNKSPDDIDGTGSVNHTLFSSVQLLGCVWLFVTPWTAAHQACLSITNSWSSLKPMSIESVMPSNHLILCRPLLLPPSNHTLRTTVMVHSVEQQVLSGRKRNAAKNLRKGTGLEARRISFLACPLTSHCLALASSGFYSLICKVGIL